MSLPIIQSCQKGQSLVETLIISLGLIALVKLSFILCWIFINILWMEHQLYQGLVCFAQQKKLEQCQYRVLRQIEKLDTLGTIKSLKIKRISKGMERVNSMAFLQQELFYQTDFKPPYSIKARELTSLTHSQLDFSWRADSDFSKKKLLHKHTSFQKNGFLQGTKVQAGFVTVLLLPFVALMVTGMLALSPLSRGIKGLTQAQSHCIQTNLQGQKELGNLFDKNS